MSDIAKPTIGRIVIASIKDAHGNPIKRPAIITRTWSTPTHESMSIQATVFPDSVNDGLGTTVGFSSMPYHPTGELENSWYWPPKV